MTGQALLFVYLGAVGTIFLLNVVQWSFFRNWIYGLFTLQTGIWFVYSFFNRLVGEDTPLSESQNMALISLVNGLVTVIFLELAHRLFPDGQPGSRPGTWTGRSQLAYGSLLLLEVSMLLADESWQQTGTGRLVSITYWSLTSLIYVVGAGLAFRRQDVVGWFFAVGSLLMLVHTFNTLFYYTGFPWQLSQSPESVNVHVRLLSSGRILQLLCFSLALAFRQRQLAVSQAIEQTQQTAQLVQGQLENELIVQRLEQEKIQVQLRALQAQVNPHFLFNSLNTLSFLIGSDPERAEVFLDELCKVYRYVLRANEQEMTDLQSELQFIRSYYHLLKTRYGDSLHLTIDVPPLYESYLLPTLTLQLLLENAVKHNVIAKTRPLYVAIIVGADGLLTLQNNLQKKRQALVSTKIGLRNIMTKFRLLNQGALQVQETPDHFIVTFPLVKVSSQPPRSLTI